MNKEIMVKDRLTVEQAVGRLGEDDLLLLNRLIVKRLKYLESVKRGAQLLQFLPGDRVTFSDNDGKDRFGTVLRVNQKTVSVKVDDSEGYWKISPHFIRHAE